MISGVRPSLLCALTSAPFSTSRRAFAGLPGAQNQRGGVHLILGIDVGAALQQQFDCFRAADGGGVHQQRRASLVARVSTAPLAKAGFQRCQIVVRMA